MKAATSSPLARSSLRLPRDGSALATRPRQTSGAPPRLRVPFAGGRLPDRPVPVADHALEGRFPSAPPHTVRPARRADREHRAPASHHARAQSGRSARNSARASNSPTLRRTLHHRRFQFAIVLAVGLLLTFVFYYRHTSAQRREAELEAQKRSRRLAAKAAAAANGGGGGGAAAAAGANGAAANGAAKPSTPAAAKSPTKSKKAKKSD